MNCCDDETPGFSRRHVLQTLSVGFGWLAMRGLLGGEMPTPRMARAFQDEGDPLAPKTPPFPAKAKRVIMLCMSGAPSHVDTFDYKPKLIADDGQIGTGKNGRGGKLMAPPWKFKQNGKSGLWISELFPEVSKHADDMCLMRGMATDVPAHPQAFLKLHTGSFQFVRPSLGAWTLYGLGTMNKNVPGFVTFNAPAIYGGAQNYGAAFLPAYYQGQRIGVEGRGGKRPGAKAGGGGGGGDPIEDLSNERQSVDQQRKQLDLVQRLNKERKVHEHDEAVDGVIQSYELAFRMQAEVPGLLDISKESKETQAAYGIGAGETDGFGRQCLLARRFAEAGVRFIELNFGNWDHHQGLRERLPANCRATDKPIAALLNDLKQRGMLKDTLVVWGGEFGRTPTAQNGDGRDHNNKGFTMWMAGGGVKGGFSYGQTDDYGAEAVEGRTTIHDLHATVLTLLGLDYDKLTFNHAGRDFRLADVDGRPVPDVIA